MQVCRETKGSVTCGASGWRHPGKEASTWVQSLEKHIDITGLFGVDQVSQEGDWGLSHCSIGWAYTGPQLQWPLSWELWVHTGKNVKRKRGN